MTKNTESLISACHELARTAKCDDYLILNEIADKLKSLRKERDSYKEMFYDSCKGLAAIANAAGIKEENDSGSPGQVIDKINSMLNIDWNFNSHPDIKVGEEMKCWCYVEKQTNLDIFINQKIENDIMILIYQNKPTPDGKNIYSYIDEEKIPDWACQSEDYCWLHRVGWVQEYYHPEYAYLHSELPENYKVLAWAPFNRLAAPEINNE